ncbi:MAG: LamG-like jellyroll fold domain-containing protein [Candidatus Aminicenantales bacterium]
MIRRNAHIYILFFFIVFCLPMPLTVADIPQASISWSPGVLSVSTVEGGNAPAQSFDVWNSGAGTLRYSVAVNQSWLSCFPTHGTSAGERDSITVSFSTAFLSVGTYTSAITISDGAADNSPRKIQVSLTVTSFPEAIIELDFEEGEGTTAFDTSGNNNNGVAFGEAVYTQDRAVGTYALSFDGIDDYVVCPGTPSLRPKDISVSLWTKPIADTSSSYAGGIIQGAYGDGCYKGFRILDFQNRPLFQINVGDAKPINISGTAFVLDEWTHVAITYDHKNIRLFQNGHLVVERPETRNINWASAAGDLTIGLAQWHFNGSIDKVMIFGSALTPQMVQQLYSEYWANYRKSLRPDRPRSPSEDRRREMRQEPPPPGASISCSSDILSGSVIAGDNAPAQSFNVWNSGEGTLSYSVAVDQDWLNCFPAYGSSTGEHDSITVSYSTALLSLGKHSAAITISDSAADNSPRIIPVTLTVTSLPPAIVKMNFEEGIGTVVHDNSGNDNHGTLEGGVVYTTDSAVGSYALAFDGIDDRIVCRANMLLQPDDFSVSLWVKHIRDTSSPKYGGIIQGAYGGGYRDGFRIVDARNSPVAQINFGKVRPVSLIGTAFTKNEWSHLVLTYDHTKIRLYQDGQLVAERPETRNINWSSMASDLTVGLAQWNFRGLIDQVMIFGTALTPQQVQRLFRQR